MLIGFPLVLLCGLKHRAVLSLDIEPNGQGPHRKVAKADKLCGTLGF